MKQVYGLKWEPGRIDGGWERGAQETASIRPPRKERTISSEDRCGGVCVGGESLSCQPGKMRKPPPHTGIAVTIVESVCLNLAPPVSLSCAVAVESYILSG